jgi:Ca2+/Na+ antiporter
MLVAILPYLGFPYSWKDNIGTVLGLLITIFSYFIFRESKKKETPETKKNFDNFLENYDFEEKPEEENIEESEKTHIRI